MSAATVTDPVAERLDRLARRLDEVAEQLDADRRDRARWAELAHELTSLGGAGMARLSNALDDAQSRGWFAAGRAAGQAADRLGAVLVADDTPSAGPLSADPPSMLALLRRLRDPHVRRGLALALDLVGALAPAGGRPQNRTTPTEPEE